MGAGERQKRSRKAITIAAVVSILLIPAASCAPPDSFDRELDRVVGPFAFNLAGWEFQKLSDDIGAAFSGQSVNREAGVAAVKGYFGLCERIGELERAPGVVMSGLATGESIAVETELFRLKWERLDMEQAVGRILEDQITGVMSELGIYNPADVWLDIKLTFPPVNFELTDPPYLLVTSPKEKIETIRTALLRTTMSREEMEKLEAEADKLGISSLVVKLGGVATYPSFVSNTGDLRWVLNTACEEWLHQYLTFRPLGFRYLLKLQGITDDPEITALDETVASLAAKEIGGLVYDRYYRTPGDITPKRNDITGFDFNAEMRETRKNVDALLAGGKVSEAESYMEERRQYLAANGYYIRKLNQAYFAFHGSYTDSATSVDPLGDDMRALRKNSGSIKDFLDRASFITSRAGLKEVLGELAGQRE